MLSTSMYRAVIYCRKYFMTPHRKDRTSKGYRQSVKTVLDSFRYPCYDVTAPVIAPVTANEIREAYQWT
jgi:hypothetical protein